MSDDLGRLIMVMCIACAIGMAAGHRLGTLGTYQQGYEAGKTVRNLILRVQQ